MSTERETVKRYCFHGYEDERAVDPTCQKCSEYVHAADYDAQSERIRTATQLIIADIGASGPESLESALGRLIGRHQGLTAQREADRLEIAELNGKLKAMVETYGDGLTLQQWARERPALQQRCEALERERARIVRERDDIYRIHLSQVAQSNDLKQQLAARVLKWTEEKPTVPGWYWWKRPSTASIGPQIRYISARLDDVMVDQYGHDISRLCEGGAEWQGPLVPDEGKP